MKNLAVKTRLLAGAAVLAMTIPAGAHGYLENSFPAAKTHFYTPPRQIRLRFSVRADAQYSELALKNEDGAVLMTKTQPHASRDFDMNSPPLPPGRYRVHYRILSTDGDLLQGSVDFFVDQ